MTVLRHVCDSSHLIEEKITNNRVQTSEVAQLRVIPEHGSIHEQKYGIGYKE